MKINKLDHVNIRTSRLEIMVGWYTEILGMKSGKRPDFPFDGAWMYAGEQAVVHLVKVGADKVAKVEGNLTLEHFAFSAQGLNDFEEKLTRLDIPFRRSDIAEINRAQINIWDPDGNHIHVDFRLDE